MQNVATKQLEFFEW